MYSNIGNSVLKFVELLQYFWKWRLESIVLLSPDGSLGPSIMQSFKKKLSICAEHQTYDSYWQHGSIY